MSYGQCNFQQSSDWVT